MSSLNDTANRIKYADPVDPWATITTPWGELPAWKADAIANGAMNVYAQVRNDAVEAQSKRADIEAREQAVTARELAADAREQQLAVSAARLRDAVGRADAQWDKIEQARADQEREQEPLAKPPGERSKEPELSLPSGEADDAAEPELHSIRGTENPDPVETDRRGEFLRLKHPVVRDQEDPPAGGKEFPDPQLARPPMAARQPAAAGLD